MRKKILALSSAFMLFMAQNMFAYEGPSAYAQILGTISPMGIGKTTLSGQKSNLNLGVQGGLGGGYDFKVMDMLCVGPNLDISFGYSPSTFKAGEDIKAAGISSLDVSIFLGPNVKLIAGENIGAFGVKLGPTVALPVMMKKVTEAKKGATAEATKGLSTLGIDGTFRLYYTEPAFKAVSVVFDLSWGFLDKIKGSKDADGKAVREKLKLNDAKISPKKAKFGVAVDFMPFFQL